MNKIPVFATVAASYGFVFGKIGRIIGLIWLPALAIVAASYFLELPYQRFIMENGADSEALMRNPSLMVGNLTAMIVNLGAMAIILAALTREVLHPSEGGGWLRLPPLSVVLRILGSYAGLIGVVILFALAIHLLVFAIGALVPADGVTKALSGVVVFILQLLLIYSVVRLAFLIAPVAVEEARFGLERSWRLTYGQFWRIFGLSLCAVFPVLLVYGAAILSLLWADIHAQLLPLMRQADDADMLSAIVMRFSMEHYPELTGLQVLFMPFLYGLTAAPAAYAYRALTANATDA